MRKEDTGDIEGSRRRRKQVGDDHPSVASGRLIDSEGRKEFKTKGVENMPYSIISITVEIAQNDRALPTAPPVLIQ